MLNQASKANRRPPWNLKQAAEYTQLSEKYIYKLTHLHLIPFHKRPGSRLLRFDPDELEAWVYSGRQATQQEIAQAAEAQLQKMSRKRQQKKAKTKTKKEGDAA